MGIVHKGCGTRLYRIWKGIRNRCLSPTSPAYSYYGGRGITICAEWSDFYAFRAWAEKSGYSDSLTIDRIDSDGHYSPNNCRWATRETQSRNRRDTVLLTVYGRTLPLTAWADILEIGSSTIHGRIQKGWSHKESLFGKPEIKLRSYARYDMGGIGMKFGDFTQLGASFSCPGWGVTGTRERCAVYQCKCGLVSVRRVSTRHVRCYGHKGVKYV